jgi:hypothetical protein
VCQLCLRGHTKADYMNVHRRSYSSQLGEKADLNNRRVFLVKAPISAGKNYSYRFSKGGFSSLGELLSKRVKLDA